MRVLLVEDDTILGAAVRDQIRADGHSVDWVTRLDAAGDPLPGRLRRGDRHGHHRRSGALGGRGDDP